MKLEALAILLPLVAVANASDGIFGRHSDIAKRQATTVSGSTAVTGTATPAVSSVASSATPAASTPAASGTTTSAVATGTTTSAAGGVSSPLPTGENGVPPLSQLTPGMPSGPPLSASQTFAPGTTPSQPPNAPPLPSTFVFSPADWPAQDKIPPTDSDEVKEWMKELEGVDIPDFSPTADGSCAGDPSAAAEAEQRGWWTCGGWTSPDDITVCNDKMTWGISFDDGPGPYTQKLLDYLDEKDLLATFFVVGSRCIERPALLIEEYMAGHELSVHTWSHHTLTAMTNEEIVAELGWTRKIIKDVTGITPTTMRAPFGDIDNRVRAIAMAMGLRPIIWTRFNGFAFDTNDWKVAGGVVQPADQLAIFESILGNATLMDTGFIVLEHDLYEITVDLAIGYTLPAALSHNPPFTLKRIGECNNIPLTDMYLETNTNKSFPAKSNNAKTNSTGAASSNGALSRIPSTSITTIGAVVAAGAAVLGGSLLL